jgi:hypothetical protein
VAQHGGRRDPSPRQGPAGPGRFSARTDGQKIQAPDLDRPDVQYGDVSQMAEAQRAVRVPTASPTAGSGGGGAQAPAARPLPALSELQAGGGLPGFMTAPTALPDQPITTGMELGAGPGPEALQTQRGIEDDFEALLEYFVNNYGDLAATETLAEMRGGSAGSPPAASPVPAAFEPPVALDVSEETELSQDLAASEDFTDMDFEEDEAPAGEVPEDEAVAAPVDEGGEAAPAPEQAAAPAPEAAL